MTARCPYCSREVPVEPLSRLAAHDARRGFRCVLGSGADLSEVRALRTAHVRVAEVARAARERARFQRTGG